MTVAFDVSSSVYFRQKESLQHEVKEKEKAIIESKDEIKVRYGCIECKPFE